MHHPGLYVIRPATPDDHEALRRLAQLDSAPRISGHILAGEIDGEIQAAMSLDEDRVIANPFLPTAYLRAALRLRAGVLQAVERKPSLIDRMRVHMPVPRAA
jgi:hypothetical protein